MPCFSWLPSPSSLCPAVPWFPLQERADAEAAQRSAADARLQAALQQLEAERARVAGLQVLVLCAL